MERPLERRERDALLFRHGEVHREDHGGGSVDRHGGRDAIEGDPPEENLHVEEGVDSDALPADLAASQRVVAVAPHQGRKVKRGGQPGLAVLQQVVKPGVRVVGRPESGELPHRPETAAIHRGMDPARVGEFPGESELLALAPLRPEIVAGVQTLDREIGDRRERDRSLLELAGRAGVAHQDLRKCYSV